MLYKQVLKSYLSNTMCGSLQWSNLSSSLLITLWARDEHVFTSAITRHRTLVIPSTVSTFKPTITSAWCCSFTDSSSLSTSSTPSAMFNSVGALSFSNMWSSLHVYICPKQGAMCNKQCPWNQENLKLPFVFPKSISGLALATMSNLANMFLSSFNSMTLSPSVICAFYPVAVHIYFQNLFFLRCPKVDLCCCNMLGNKPIIQGISYIMGP